MVDAVGAAPPSPSPSVSAQKKEVPPKRSSLTLSSGKVTILFTKDLKKKRKSWVDGTLEKKNGLVQKEELFTSILILFSF